MALIEMGSVEEAVGALVVCESSIHSRSTVELCILAEYTFALLVMHHACQYCIYSVVQK